MPPDTEVGLGPGHIVLDGTQFPHGKGTAAPTFAVYGQTARTMSIVAIGQAAGWIRIPLGTQVGLGPCDIVLDGDPASPVHEEGHSNPSHFSAHFALSDCYSYLG